MTKICIIGGSGFVGNRLINLIKDNYEIKIIDKKLSKSYPELSVLCDIRNIGCLREVLNGYEIVVHLAAEHTDDVSPFSLYYDVNVQGTKNILEVMDINNIHNLIFTSSVAIYGLNKSNPDEDFPADPFNHYGKSKWQAEEALRDWYEKDPNNRSLTIIRPAVIFGERNRGNVYNLLNQIASGTFIMIGKGMNIKSMVYIENIAAFLKQCIETMKPSYRLYNYVDKPDLNMNDLVRQVEISLNKKIPSLRLPYWLGYLGGFSFDLLARLTGKKYPISTVRIKKFCATTQFDSVAVHRTGFIAPYSISEGLHRTLQYEFLLPVKDQVVYTSE
jgi:nucleoside-diphosphate-sugar epimerase